MSQNNLRKITNRIMILNQKSVSYHGKYGRLSDIKFLHKKFC